MCCRAHRYHSFETTAESIDGSALTDLTILSRLPYDNFAVGWLVACFCLRLCHSFSLVPRPARSVPECLELSHILKGTKLQCFGGLSPLVDVWCEFSGRSLNILL